MPTAHALITSFATPLLAAITMMAILDASITTTTAHLLRHTASDEGMSTGTYEFTELYYLQSVELCKLRASARK